MDKGTAGCAQGKDEGEDALNELLNSANFKDVIGKMEDRKLAEWTAEQVFSICKTCETHRSLLENHDKRLKVLEKFTWKMFVVTGSSGGGVFGIIYAIIQVVKGG